MSQSNRRLAVYWLLLLLPTLAVGAGAMALLRREQARLQTQSAYAVQAREAALAARAQLIVENLELLVGDVQAGLLDTLAATPGTELGAFLDAWENTNPLVKTAFVARPDGRVTRPAPSATGEAAQGFLRRFRAAFPAQPPWSETEELKRVSASKDEAEVRAPVASNVAQMQNARRDVQELFKTRDAAAAASAAPVLADSARSAERTRAESDRSTPLAEVTAQRPASASRTKSQTQERRGWHAVTLDGRLHILAWVQPVATAAVRGVEVDVEALIARLGGVLPVETAPGEGFVLRSAQGRIMHQAGWVPRNGGLAAIRVPVAMAVLPGWQVEGFLDPATSIASSRAFVWLGGGLVALLTIAILAGGTLLTRQARRSEWEAQQKTSFVANVSHELKTPLTTIRLYSELLEQGRVRDAAQGSEYLRTIGRETQRLGRLVNNVLDFSRLEQGRKTFARQRVDVGAELRRLAAVHEPRIRDAGLTLELVVPNDELSAELDRDALEQILLNLIDNACKYAGGGGGLRVAAERGASGVKITVADRGPGVPPEHRERIFDTFHRVDDTLTAEKGGAGLGLSIARQLARGMGGELRYLPREGGGSEFVLELQ